MWQLTSCSGREVRYGLEEGKEYTVGRQPGSSLVVGRTDLTVSRNHAVIAVERLVEDAAVPRRPKVLVSEGKASAYGTYVGEDAIRSSGASSQADRVKEGERAEMTQGTRVRFGLSGTVFQLLWSAPFVVCTSTLATKDRKALGASLLAPPQLGRLTNSWSDQVTHLAVHEVILTIKVANALAKGVPIVRPEFFSDYAACVGSNQVLPDEKSFVPRLKEDAFNPNEVDLGVLQRRQTLFKGKCFAFASKAQLQRFDVAIGYSGGKVILVDSDKPDPETFEVPSNVLVEPAKGESVSKLWDGCVARAEAKGLNLVNEQNIGKAVMTCKVDGCDPARGPYKLLGTASGEMGNSGAVLAPESQARPSSNPPICSTVTRAVPETLSESAKVEPKPVVKTDPDEDAFVLPSALRTQQGESSTTGDVHEDEEDLFEFEAEAETGMDHQSESVSGNRPQSFSGKRPRSSVDEETVSGKRPRGDEPEESQNKLKEGLGKRKQPLEETPSPKKRPKTTEKGPKPSSFVVNASGFVGKASSTFDETVKSECRDVSEEDLTRSYAKLEIKSLVVVKALPLGPTARGRKAAVSDGNNNNAKSFQKQRLSWTLASPVPIKLHETTTASGDASDEGGDSDHRCSGDEEPPTGQRQIDDFFSNGNERDTGAAESQLWDFQGSQAVG